MSTSHGSVLVLFSDSRFNVVRTVSVCSDFQTSGKTFTYSCSHECDIRPYKKCLVELSLLWDIYVQYISEPVDTLLPEGG